MKIIIDPYRGGKDTGKLINNEYEKNLLLKLSKYMNSQFKDLNIDSELIRNSDMSLTDDERNSIINEIKNDNDIIIQNRLSDDNILEIIYPLRSSDAIASLISSELESNGIEVSKYYQRRLPTNTLLDYYNVIRNTNPNETLIIEYNDLTNYEQIVDIIAKTIARYVKKENTYTVVKGDSLYKIAQKFGTTVDDIKELNNLTSNTLMVNQKLLIPSAQTVNEKKVIYTVTKGDTLYQIAKKNNITVQELKNINNLKSDTLNIEQKLIIPKQSLDFITYIVKSGDTLYQIAKQNNTTINDIKLLNNLNNDLLSIGQPIKIPR